MNFCFHKFEKVENGYQYCLKCGVARVVPPIPCVHKWEEISRKDIFRAYAIHGKITTGQLFVLKCKNCGEITNTRIEVD
jgi:hypothetical protein